MALKQLIVAKRTYVQACRWTVHKQWWEWFEIIWFKIV